MLHDARIALRTLARSPGFTAVVLLTLGLGIGSISAVFSVVNAVLLTAIPFEEPDRIAVLTGVRVHDGAEQAWLCSWRDIDDWRRRNEVFESLAGGSLAVPRSFNFAVEGEPEHVLGEMVSSEYLRVLGITPFLGRFFAPEEDTLPAGQRVAVISHGLWRRYFGGGDQPIDGRTLLIDGEGFQVVGVAPPGFRGFTDEAEIWVPLTTAADLRTPAMVEDRGFRWLSALARLKPGVSIEKAQADLDSIAAGLEAEHPDLNQGVRVKVESLEDAWFAEIRGTLLALLAFATIVLLIASTNVANLLLARTLGRRQELGVRAALGAARKRLVRQLLTESTVLALLGSGIGLLLAHWGTGVLLAASSIRLKSFVEVSTDPLVVLVVAGLAVVCGLGIGIAPAVTSSQVQLTEALKEGGKGSAGGARLRIQGALVVLEVALTLMLLVAATLAVKSFQELQSTDLGFRPRGILSLRVDLKGERYRPAWARRLMARRFLEELGGVPGVDSLALVGPYMPSDGWGGGHYTIEERESSAEDEKVLLVVHHVSPGYFSTLEVPLLAGRAFLPSDRSGNLVAMVSASAVRQFWPGPIEEVLGQRLKPGDRDSPAGWLTVVGVVDDVQQTGFQEEDHEHAHLYLPMLQQPPSNPPVINFLVRAEEESSAAALAGPLREQLQALAPDLPVYDVATLESRLAAQLSRDRFGALLITLFTALALVLATVGIYGVIAYTVTQRARELGIRLALGAGRGRVFRQILRRGAVLALAGIGIGLGLALASARLASSLFFGLAGVDLLTLLGTSMLLLGVSLGASFLPAWRATRIDPNTVLRIE